MKKESKFQIIQLEGAELRRYQECLLDIMKDFAITCEKEKLDYALAGGSILGAVRHNGFIPWDDDIDVWMPRESYNKLLDVFNKELDDKYYIQTPQMYPELGLVVTQLRKKGTIARRKYDWKMDPCGISIDIYVLENVFDNPIKRFVQKNMSMLCTFAISSIRFCENQDIPKELIELEGRDINYANSKSILGKILGIIPLKIWINWCIFWNSCCKDINTRLVASPTGRKHFNKEIYERSEMCAYRKVKFETEEFNIPICAEKFLKCFYGNYKEIPPEEKRERHLFLELKF